MADHDHDTDGRTDEAKGRLKEAAGALTGDDNLRDEGRGDQRKGKMKQAGEKVKDALDDAKEGLSR